jgi:hypothetical protein
MATPTGFLFYDPQAKPLSTTGTYQPGAYWLFYATGTTTPVNVYADGFLATPLSQVPGANQPSCTADSAGRFNPIYLNPSQIYRVQLYNSVGQKLEDTDPYVPGTQLTGAVVGAALYGALTTAEANAGLTAANITPQYPPLTLERYGGGVGALTATNDAAMASLMAVLIENGGGVVQVPAPGAPNGTYNFSQGVYIPEYTIIQGAGQDCQWLYSGSAQFLTMASGTLTSQPTGYTTGGRSVINDILITGTNQVGDGITLGDSGGNATHVHLNRVIMNGWGGALNIIGTNWSTFRDCEFGSALGGSAADPIISNLHGIAINPINSSNYTSVVSFYDCIVSNNSMTGVYSNNTTLITANNFTWINCNIQNNCTSAGASIATTPQFFMGLVRGFTITGMYLEYVLGGGDAPAGVSFFGAAGGHFLDFFINTSSTGIIDGGGGSCNTIDIGNGEIGNSLSGIDISMTSDPDIFIHDVTHVGTVTLTGTGSLYLPTGTPLTPWTVNETAFTPVLTPAGGTITQTAVGSWSQLGNLVTVSGSISWTANSGTGGVTLTGLPIAVKAVGPPAVGSLYFSGITVPASSQLSLSVSAGAVIGSLSFSEASNTQLAASAMGSTGALEFSLTYQV